MGAAMKYAKLEVLSDLPQRKFLCIRIEGNKLTRNNTQICNVPVDNVMNAPRGLITVVVKGADLPYNVIEQIVHAYLNGTLQLQPGSLFQIVEE